jgi:hypothetical protein
MCILVDGQVQKELANGCVPIPFGTNYSLRLRNKNDRRAVVKFSIDNENVSGAGFIVPANDYIDIKRHADKDCGFKFVDLDSPEAVDAGKNGANEDKVKGVIEARFYLEKKIEQPKEVHIHHYDHYYPQPYIGQPYIPWRDPYKPYSPSKQYPDITFYSSNQHTNSTRHKFPSTPRSTGKSRGGSICGQSCGQSYGYSLETDQPTAGYMSNSSVANINSLQDGCTVEGKSTGQLFSSTYIDIEKDCVILKLFLQGYYPEKPVKVRKTKSQEVRDLKRENKRLRKQLAERE